MGEYADMAIADGFDEWANIERAIADGDYEYDDASLPGVRFPRFGAPRPSPSAKPCRGCGKGGLYWLPVDGKWRLHHYTLFGSMTHPGYVLHRCGFTSDGQPTGATAPPTPETAAAKVAPVIEGEGSREAIQTLLPTPTKEG